MSEVHPLNVLMPGALHASPAAPPAPVAAPEPAGVPAPAAPDVPDRSKWAPIPEALRAACKKPAEVAPAPTKVLRKLEEVVAEKSIPESTTKSVLWEQVAFDFNLAVTDPRLPIVRKLREIAEMVKALTVTGTTLPTPDVTPALQDTIARTSGPRTLGRPAMRRFGSVTSADGKTTEEFDSMQHLAHRLDCSYNALCHKYAKVCAEQGVNPNDHDGVEFDYKFQKVSLFVR